MARNGHGELNALTLLDFSDYELLAIIDDHLNDDGWASVWDIAETLGIKREHAQRCVSSRFSWMKRWGWIQKHPDERGLYALTAVGEALAKGRLTKAAERALSDLSPGDRVRVTRKLAVDTAQVGFQARKMMQREWRRVVDA